jgi:hypothetical protein
MTPKNILMIKIAQFLLLFFLNATQHFEIKFMNHQILINNGTEHFLNLFDFRGHHLKGITVFQ